MGSDFHRSLFTKSDKAPKKGYDVACGYQITLNQRNII